MSRRSLVLLLGCCLLPAAAFSADTPAAKDEQAMQGEWKVVAIEVEGVGKPEYSKNVRITIKGDELAIYEKNVDATKTSKFKLVPEASPKSIDITPAYGALKGKTAAGIYKLEKGRLTICVVDKDNRGRDITERPKEFKTAPEDGLAMITLEKVKPK